MNIRRSYFGLNGLLACLFLVLQTAPAWAGIVVEGTRVVYPSNKREVSVNLRNNGSKPALAQVWIDDGNAKAKPGEAKVPFVLAPPLFRIDPAKGQTLRIVYTRDLLPSDRETVFWLNVLDIPPRAAVDPDAPNRLELAFRHRMKLFFRPVDLPGKAGEAPGQVTWTLATRDGKQVLEARNPTPYHVSFSRFELVAGGNTVKANADMLAPFAQQTFGLEGQLPGGSTLVSLKYSFVNDFGGATEGEAPVQLVP
ncbi:MAG: fimbria/pilus periplasmic chaperone [Limnohabitans sp.]